MGSMTATHRIVTMAAAIAALAVVTGCSGRRGLEPARPDAAPADVRSAEAPPPRTAAPAGVPAVWRNDAVVPEELNARAAEAAGALVLEEILVERALRTELARRGLSVDDAALAREESMAREALSADPARAEQLLQALRASQGLGAIRWVSLLWRNAALRTIAREQSSVGEAEIATAYDLRHGPRRAARIIVLADLTSVQAATDRLKAGEPFSDVATAMSSDASRDRGGLVSPVSRMDPTWPAPVREALWALAPGERSAPVLTDDGYILVRCEGELAGSGIAPEAVRAESERTARLAIDRVEMDRILREIVRSLDPTIFDRSLEESWKRTRDMRRVP
jgi:parvulin-like peptidyl-prolyl isomerase